MNCYHCGKPIGTIKAVQMRIIEDPKNPHGFPVKIHPLCAVGMHIPEEYLDDESMGLIELASRLRSKAIDRTVAKWTPKQEAKQEEHTRNLVDVVEGENE